MIQTSLSPNAQKDDIFLALATLLQPWKWGRQDLVMKVERALASLVRTKYVTATASGRTALYTLLRALQIGEGDEVIVQAYTCVAVPDPVLWAGATPIYVDCTEHLTMDVEDLKKKITPRTKAIVVQHTFGMPANIHAIISIAREHNIAVLEDCAHALGGEVDAAPLGSFGDAAFFSFGRDKCISSVFGGAIATNDSHIHAKVREIISLYPLPSSLWVIRQLLHPVVLGISKSTYNIAHIGKYFLAAARRLHIISRAVEPTELSGGMPDFILHRYSPALAILAAHQLKKLPAYVLHRQSCVRTYIERLSSIPSLTPPPFVEGHAYLRYTLFVDNPQDYIKKARKQGIELGDWYSNVLAPNGVVYTNVGYTPGSCPNAERLAARSLNLPTHIGMMPAMIHELVTHVFM